MKFIAALIIAYLLDFLISDPGWLPHPIRFIGKEIEILEKLLRKIPWERTAGILLTVIVVLTTYVATFLLVRKFGFPVEVLLLFFTLCTRSLGKEPMKAIKALENKDIESARKEVSYLVSRDTQELDEQGVLKACIETVAENTVDGIISPVFYASLGGVTLAMAFKAISTLDSMVGYKNEKYIRFGWASAKLDDLANFIPARLSIPIVALSSLIIGESSLNSVKIALRDRKNHESLNSAIPEAAFAGTLKIRLGGPSSYFGKLVKKPYIGDDVESLNISKAKNAIKLMYISSFISLVVAISICFIRTQY